MKTIHIIIAGALSIWLSNGALADQAAKIQPSIELVSAGKTLVLTPQSLADLPPVEQDVTFKTSKGVSTGHYKGPLLWDVVKASKALAGLDHNKELAKTLMVTASDGYQIAYSIGEIAPEFGNATILVALETDGQPMKDGLRIVAQGDKRGARAIHNVVKIELR
ncbi:MAG TPA: hypothetical protein VIU14_09660 [Mesorhizobium sp.]|jgi:hypothetical protein